MSNLLNYARISELIELKRYCLFVCKHWFVLLGLEFKGLF